MFVPGACVLRQFARTIEWEIDDGRVWQVIYVTVFVTKILPQTNVVVTCWITMKCDQRHVVFWRLKAGASFDQFRRLMTPTAKCSFCPSLLSEPVCSTYLATTTPPQCGAINCFLLIITFSLFCKRAALMLNEIQARAELLESDRSTFWITAMVTWSNGWTFSALVGYCGSTVRLLLGNCCRLPWRREKFGRKNMLSYLSCHAEMEGKSWSLYEMPAASHQWVIADKHHKITDWHV